MRFYKCNLCGTIAAETELIGHGECPKPGCGDSIAWPGNVVAKIINCTPHTVNIGELEIKPSGILPRLSESRKVVSNIAGININFCNFGKTDSLPERNTGTVYIVSRVVAEANKTRNDLIFPDELIRDDKGRTIGCSSIGTVCSSVSIDDEKRQNEIKEKLAGYSPVEYSVYEDQFVVYVKDNIDSELEGMYFPSVSSEEEHIKKIQEQHGIDAILDEDGEVIEY